ncbi:MAG: HK97 gp10 family phage protein [Pseudomonadota bacterium]
MRVELDLQRWNELEAAWQRAPEMVAQELARTTMEAELLLQREVQELTPTGTLGALRASISAHVPEVMADNVIGVVGTSLSYAVPVEIGTKPHWAPIQPLLDWVQAKFGLHGPAAESAARRVQFGIAHHGTPAVGMFHRTFNKHRAQVALMYEAARGRIVSRLAGA